MKYVKPFSKVSNIIFELMLKVRKIIWMDNCINKVWCYCFESDFVKKCDVFHSHGSFFFWLLWINTMSGFKKVTRLIVLREINVTYANCLLWLQDRGNLNSSQCTMEVSGRERKTITRKCEISRVLIMNVEDITFFVLQHFTILQSCF